MNLKRELRRAGYDLIDSPVRNHKVLQLWLKRPMNRAELYYENIHHALESQLPLNVQEDAALSVTYDSSQEYKFNVGVSILDNLLTALGLGNLDLSAKFNKGKKISLSYNSSKTLIVPIGELDGFLTDADFRHPNKTLLQNANRDNILVISGILAAKDFKATIETNAALNADLETTINEIAEGSLSAEIVSENKMVMTSEGNSFFPVAVKADRIDWDKGEFTKTTIVTDNRLFF